MKWMTFAQVVALLILVACLFYLLYPKYEFHAPKETEIIRGNVITGKIVHLSL